MWIENGFGYYSTLFVLDSFISNFVCCVMRAKRGARRKVAAGKDKENSGDKVGEFYILISNDIVSVKF
jgi:hypothetical protein